MTDILSGWIIALWVASCYFALCWIDSKLGRIANALEKIAKDKP